MQRAAQKNVHGRPLFHAILLLANVYRQIKFIAEFFSKNSLWMEWL
jgi:hypothetical protein